MTFDSCGDSATNAISEELVLSFLKPSMMAYERRLVANIEEIMSKFED